MEIKLSCTIHGGQHQFEIGAAFFKSDRYNELIENLDQKAADLKFADGKIRIGSLQSSRFMGIKEYSNYLKIFPWNIHLEKIEEADRIVLQPYLLNGQPTFIIPLLSDEANAVIKQCKPFFNELAKSENEKRRSYELFSADSEKKSSAAPKQKKSEMIDLR